MAFFRCKICGGQLEISPDDTVAECLHCGTRQTLPKLDDERRTALYERANHYRRNNEYDNAMSIYEQMLAEDNADAEAYWSLVLCRYGIEYIEDPVTHRQMPTINRIQFTPILADKDYQSAIANADILQKSIYEDEARVINDLQKSILAISKQEEPFDVFICYKETDASGRRSMDSVLATDIYNALRKEGFKVFFSRITLEDKLGVEYEPYIFAALHSAKAMIVVGTKPEHFNAVWVKNEWYRFLELIKQGASKILIPAYRDMSPKDLPAELVNLQAQDMGKLGYLQDLIQGIKKLIVPEPLYTTPLDKIDSYSNQLNPAPLLKRAFMFLEDKNWKSADEYCERVLDIDPEIAMAYVGKLMAELKVSDLAKLAYNRTQSFEHNGNYIKAIRFGDEQLKTLLSKALATVENNRLDDLYTKAKHDLESYNYPKDELNYKRLATRFGAISGWKDSAELEKQCLEHAEIARKNATYNKAMELREIGTEATLSSAAALFRTISGWKDADDRIHQCHSEVARIRNEEDVYQKDVLYAKALELMEAGGKENLQDAIRLFQSLSGWRDAETLEEICIGKIKPFWKSGTASNNQEPPQEKKKLVFKRGCLHLLLAFVALIVFIILLSKCNYAYRKSQKKVPNPVTLEQIKTIGVGNTVRFGHYEQDNNPSNGKEPIVWRVLAKENEKVLVISEYILDGKAYNQTRADVTWENCTLRIWLNSDFINEAFSTEEKSKILEVVNINADNPRHGTKGGNKTSDKVFLLSVEEAEKYKDLLEYMEATPYAEVQGASDVWTLRTPGSEQDSVANFQPAGIVNQGWSCDSTVGNRPAMWLRID